MSFHHISRVLFFLTFASLAVEEVRGVVCSSPFNATSDPNPSTDITKSLKLWQGVLFIVGFGTFGLLVALAYRLIRAYVFYDDNLVDTFFNAGGNANFAMVACCVVIKRLWVASYSFSTADVRKFGLVGHFWYSAAGVIHLLIFAILAAEIRIKAPGAKTFLQVIRSRFGSVPHITVMIFALFTNIIIAGLVMAEGTRILTWLCQDISQYVICIILTLSVGVYTVVGGLGGAMYMAYFLVACVMAICLVYFSDTAFHSLNRPDYDFTDFFSDAYTSAYCAKPNGILLTFLSNEGMMQGIVFALAGFSSVFVNQGFWSTAISARPSHSVWGYLTGGFVWFSIPFLLSFIFGMSYWIYSYHQGTNLVSDMQASFGALPVIVSQKLMGRFGDFMMYALTLAVVLGAVSSEILSISSIVVYDIFQSYLYTFAVSRSIADTPCGVNSATDAAKQAIVDLYLKYNRNCVIFQWIAVIVVAILVYPITLIILAIGMEPQWLFNFLGVVVGSAVIPIILAVVWHRTTGPGVTAGVLVGFACGFSAWLIFASRFVNGLYWFEGNTGRQIVFITGLAVSLGIGGLVCIFVSLTCGGCDPHRNEEEEWEKCRTAQVLPWSTHFYPDLNSVNQYTGLPHYYALRRIHKCAEISAYVLGILLSIGVLIVWPAIMLSANVFSADVFHNWGIMVFVWAVIAAVLIGLVPLLYEIIDKCCVTYHVRVWKHRLAMAQAPVEEFQTAGPYVPSVGTCQSRTVRVKPQTFRLVDRPISMGTAIYPTKYRSSVDSEEYCTFPTPGCVVASRLGTVNRGWQTLVHLD